MKYSNSSNWNKGVFAGLFLSLFLFLGNLSAQENAEMSEEAKQGMAIFEGHKRLKNGGPSCITCHNVTNNDVMAGGLFAKDLTDVYERFGVGLASWLQVPDPPAMAASYNYAPLEEDEREDLAAFFKSINETKDEQTAKSGGMYLLGGGLLGLLLLLLLLQLHWRKRKKNMVKADIFSRQNSALDAKF